MTKTPVWLWDWKQEKYLRLPPGLQCFEDGKWGFGGLNQESIEFVNEHSYLFVHEASCDAKGLECLIWYRVVIKEPPKSKHWYNQDKARITKVQR